MSTRIRQIDVDELWRMERQLDSMDQHLHLLLSLVRKLIGDTRVYKPGKGASHGN